jgi:hypothetical protein
MHDTPCPLCGAPVGGLDACVDHVNQLLAQAYAEANYAGVYRLAFDAFCMQHPERYCVSAKSYAAHLMGLCHGNEHADEVQSYWAIATWLNTPRDLIKPELLTKRGTMTIADMRGAASPREHAQRVRAWAADVWIAYASQHASARAWLRQATGEAG